MNFGKFFGQLFSVPWKSEEQQEELKSEKKNPEVPKTSLPLSKESLSKKGSLKAETTQDFRQIISQFDFFGDQHKSDNDTPMKPPSTEPKADEIIAPPLEKGDFKNTIPNGGTIKEDGKNVPMSFFRRDNDKVDPNFPSETSHLPPTTTIKFKPIVANPVRKQTGVELLDQKRKQELEAEYLKKLDHEYKGHNVAPFKEKMREKAIIDEDEEEIARVIRNGTNTSNCPYKPNQFPGNFGEQHSAPPIFQNPYNNASMNTSFDTGGSFFSAGGGKPIAISSEAIKAAKDKLADLGFDEEVQNFDNANQARHSTFVNPFQSANQGFEATSNLFAQGTPSFSNFNEELPKFSYRPIPNEVPFSNGFGKATGDSNGAISFTTGNLNGAVNIKPEMMRKAMALFADDDDDEDIAKDIQSGIDENARMGPPQIKVPKSPVKAALQPNPVKNAFNGKPAGEIALPNKVIFTEDEMGNEDEDKKAVQNLEEYSLRAVINKASKEQVSVSIGQKQPKNPFSVEPAKKVAKKAFEVPREKGLSSVAPKLNFVKPSLPRVKTAVSKLHNIVEIDNERYTKITSNLKKRARLQGYKEKRVTKNYGWRFLTLVEIYGHLKSELDELDIKGVDEFMDQVIIEIRNQLNRPDIEVGWVEHHLKMMSRKYYNRIKNEGASSSSCLGKNCAIIPYKVNLRNILTDLYYRYKREEYFQRLSVLRLMNEGQFQADQRVCLMIVSISNAKDKYIIELTDGWYLVYMELYTSQEKELILRDSKDCYQEFNNNLILRLILKGHLFPGQKVEISHMKVERQESQPIYKPTKVEFYYNALRRLPWNSQMGLLYTKVKPTKLKDIKPCGGVVPMIDVLILEKRGVKISNPERDEFMIRMQHSDNERMSISFSLIVVDSLHLDPNYKAPVSLHMVSFKSVDPGKYLDISVGQRLQIYGVKMRKSKQYAVTQANYITQIPWGLHFTENRRNSSVPFDIPLTLRSDKYHQILELRKKEFVPLEEMKEALLKVMNLPRGELGDFLICAAVKYVKHSDNRCLFHFYEKHFLQVEIRAEETVKPPKKKEDSKGVPPQAPFWERVMRDLCAISESNCELLLFYDLTYSRTTKIIELMSRGKIYIHKFYFDVINDYMLGENFILTNIENSSLERFLLSEYKKSKNIKLGDNDSIAQLLCDMSKYPLN